MGYRGSIGAGFHEQKGGCGPHQRRCGLVGTNWPTTCSREEQVVGRIRAKACNLLRSLLESNLSLSARQKDDLLHTLSVPARHG